MKELSFNVNENEQLVINKIVIDLFDKCENFNHYKMEIKGRAKLTKFWEQVLEQANKTNFSGKLYEQFSYATIETEDFEITFNCPKNEYKNIWQITIDLKIK